MANANRIATGTPGLDKMLGGGLLPGGVYSIIGPPGSGKSAMAMQFLIEGVKRGENGLIIALDEHPCQIRENLGQMFGQSFDRIYVLDATLEMRSYERTPLRDVSITRHAEQFGSVFPEIPRSADVRNPELGVGSIQEICKMEIREKAITRVVVDSVTSLQYFMMPGLERNLFMQSFLRFLSDLPVTTMITIQEGDYPVLDQSCIEFIMSKGVVKMHRWLQDGTFKLGVSVAKLRGSDHDDGVREARMSPIGLQIADKGAKPKEGK